MAVVNFFGTFLGLLLALSTVSTFSLGELLNPTTFYLPDPNEEGKVIPAYLGPVVEAAWTPNVSDVAFLLLTKNIDVAEELLIDDVDSVEESNFIRNAPVKVLVHGFGGSPSSGFPRRVANAYVLRGDDVNVIIVNWARLATSPWYNIAAPSTRFVGEHIGAFIEFLVEEGFVNLEDVHLVGHSLGAHVVSNAGRVLDGRVGRITALDPALPFFDTTTDDYRIDPTDGVFVDVLHTAGGYLTDHGLAFQVPRGHADFYPNNGEAQPGCDAEVFGSCSHSRAPSYFMESILNPTAFPACSCEHWYLFLAAKCDCTNPVFMGDPANKTAKGRYYLLTSSNSTHYGLGISGLTNAVPTTEAAGSGGRTVAGIGCILLSLSTALMMKFSALL